MRGVSTSLAALAVAASSASAAYQGFNYGATFSNGAPKTQADFENDFKTAAGLEGTNGGFKSARIFTLVQAGTANDVIGAVPAAISTKTSLLFGLWASAGEEAFNNELSALQKIISQYCGQLDGLVAGISVGSEDLYRISPIGIKSGSNPGVGPDTIVSYIKRTREAINNSCLKSAPVGHVDTWTAWVNGSNKAAIEASDFIGFDAYPYFEDTLTNPIAQGSNLFQSALDQTSAVAGGKPIWITETGWPVSGKTSGQAVPSLENARNYWRAVGCPRFGGNVNVWWYTLQDAAPDTPNPSFGVVGPSLSTKPLYDLSCPAKKSRRGIDAPGPDALPARHVARQMTGAGNSSTTPVLGTPLGTPAATPGAGGGIDNLTSSSTSSTSSTAGPTTSTGSGGGSGNTSGAGTVTAGSVCAAAVAVIFGMMLV